MSDRRVKSGNERVDMTDKRVMKQFVIYHKSDVRKVLYKRIFAFFVLITLLLFVRSVKGQQLIFNGSLEDVNICDENKAACSPSAWFYLNKTAAVGYSKFGTRKLNKYLRILAAREDTTTRQYWETRLAGKLQSGKRYKVTFRIFDENSNPDLSDIGFYFCDNPIFSFEDSLLQPDNYIAFSDAKSKGLKDDWHLVEKEFVASVNSAFLIIGNFSKLNNAEILTNRNVTVGKYYLAIDELSLECLEKNSWSPDPGIKDSLYSLTRRHYIAPFKYAVKEKASQLKIPVIVDDLEPRIDTIRLSDIVFALNKHTLKEVSVLDSYQGQLIRKNIDHINVIGFTDSSGTQKYNNELSIKRAGEIARLIQSRFGIGTEHIKYEGRGESIKYKDDSMNRRVEIIIYYK